MLKYTATARRKAMGNLKKVIKFEISKQIRKKSFWISIFIFPLMMLIFGGVGYLNVKLSEEKGNSDRKQIISSTKKETYKIGIIDNSNFIDKKLIRKLNLTPIEEINSPFSEYGKTFKIDALIIYEKKLVKKGYHKYIYNNSNKKLNKDLENGVDQLSKYLISESVKYKFDEDTKKLIKGNIKNDSKIFDKDGQNYKPIKKMIVPGIFLIVFFLIFIMSSNQMLVAVTEEKENRVAEMILTSVKGKTLILGKIIGLIITSIIQMLSIFIPLIIVYFVGLKFFNFPPFIQNLLTGLFFEFWPIFFGAMFLIFGFLMATSLVILVGSLFPTAQEAGQFFGPIILTFFMPFYFLTAIASGSKSLIVMFLSYFPTTSTMTMLIRNTTGNLPITEGFIGLVITIVFTFISIKLATRAFKSGLFEYSKKLSIKDLIKNKN